MKKIQVLTLILSMLLAFCVPALAAERTYEIWDQSPYITSGYTIDYMNMQKAIKSGNMKLYNLDSIGEEYYFALCPEKLIGGGKNGNTDYLYFHGFVLCLTDDNYIVISTCDFRDNQYDRASTPNIYDVSDCLDKSYYAKNKWETPQYVISMKYKINNNDKYAEYVIITDTGNSYDYSMDMVDKEEGYPFVLNQKLYMGYHNYVSKEYIKSYQVDGKDATYAPILTFSAGTQGSTGTSMFITEELSTYDSYISLHESEMMSNMKSTDYYKIPNSDELYMDYSFTKTDAEAYWSIQVDIYKSINGHMYLRNSGLITTDKTTPSSKVTILNPGEQASVPNQSTPALLIEKYGAIIDDGRIIDFKQKLSQQQYYSNQITKYKGRLAIIRNRTALGYYAAYDENDTKYYFQKINYINILNSVGLTISEDIDLKIESTGYENLDGYFSYNTTFVPPTTIREVTVTDPAEWFGREMSNVFPDGRYVECYWIGDGYYTNEIWYNIFDKSGAQIATGPTGYVRCFNASPSDTIYNSLMPIAINNSKFIVCMQTLEHDLMREYYRSSISHEQIDGEVDSTISGSKKLSRFQESDTEPVEIDIDLSKDELPIGFDIKDNVINSDKLESGLRDQINSIRLNDIVIIAKSGYLSGSQNTGVYLESFNKYDYSMGSTYIRLYSNGQTLSWYCYYPEKLTSGTYNKAYAIDDKIVYVTVKVIKAPAMDGAVAVVF